MFNITKLLPKQELIIVSGHANGADRLGEKFAKEYGLKVKIYKAKWDKFGKVAGFYRNNEMAQNSDYLLAFWDGKSNGTKHMIETAKIEKLITTVISY